ncbi:integral membrane sensor hybrid histidine kinase, partial [mine drainage metagenome]
MRGADGSLFTAVRDGLLGFAPLRRAPTVPAPTPLLTRIVATGEGHAQALLPVDGALRLGWRARELGVTARALSYLSPARVRYRFRLQPWSRNWVEVGADGAQNFGRLDPGRYRLELQAQVMSGGPWGAAAPLRVEVAAPPWATPWAWVGYVLLALLLLATLALLWRRRLAQQQRMLLAEERRRVAEQASASKTRFLAELGHEIRTPMTGVLGMSELLLGTVLDARQRGYAQAIARSGGLLQKLVNDALDLARIEAGRMQLEITAYDPLLLIFELAEAERPLAAAKGLDFLVDTEPATLPHRVLGDVLRVKQILFNLLGNALKFTAQGEVRLGLSVADEHLCFTVADTGPGIDTELRTRLFRRYEQADGPQRSAGSGLGLAISRELTEMMGGTLELESQPGRGSHFCLRLPLQRAPAQPGAAILDAASVPPLQLALVEDDPTVVAVLRGLLEAQGHQLRHAADGLAALSLLHDWQPDALLLDLDLPGVDGFAVARLLRAREAEGAHLPILAISARSGGDEVDLVAAAGMDGFLRKPITGAVLAEALA